MDIEVECDRCKELERLKLELINVRVWVYKGEWLYGFKL